MSQLSSHKLLFRIIDQLVVTTVWFMKNAMMSFSDDSKLQASTLSLFESVNTNLSSSPTASGTQFVTLMLIDSLCEGFPCAQELLHTTGCLYTMLDILR